MYMNNTEPVEIDEYRLELENRIRNLLWTVSGDYQLDMKPDVSLFSDQRQLHCMMESSRALLPDIMIRICSGFILLKKYFFRQERMS